MINSILNHQVKTCPRCRHSFECRAGDIEHCQCYGIDLPAHVKDYMADKYNDCLCRNCLLQLNHPVHFDAELAGNSKKR